MEPRTGRAVLQALSVPYAQPTYGKAEIEAVVEALSDPAHLVSGPRIDALERRVAALLGQRHGVMVNSGSSANLLALTALKKRHGLRDGARVLSPALSGGWIPGPIRQARLEPVFCDVVPGRYTAGPEEVEEGLRRTGASLVVVPLLLGELPDTDGIVEVCDRHGVPLIFDACDTLGYPSVRTAGAEAVTTSFYATHVITAAGTGGLVAFREEEDSRVARALAKWGRKTVLTSGEDQTDRFASRLDGIAYDTDFIFQLEAYNLQPAEVQAAFALAQLRTLSLRVAQRRLRWNQVYEALRPHDVDLPVRDPEAAWLAFPFRVRGEERTRLARELEARGIQTRPIMGGNVLRQPALSGLAAAGERSRFGEADHAMARGILVAAHQGLTDEQAEHLIITLDELLS